MEKLRDFFYNKNDIIVALLILVIALAVIYVKVMDLMGYPGNLIKIKSGIIHHNTSLDYNKFKEA